MTTLYYTETETIKRIQFNTQTTQYTQPSSCSDRPYITIPTAPASLTTVTNTRILSGGDLIQISRTSWFTMDPNCYHTGFDKTVFLDRNARTSSYAFQYISTSTMPSLCPRQYTLAVLWTSKPNGDYPKRTTVNPRMGEEVQYTSYGDLSEELWGVCCPYDEAIYNNYDGTSGFYFHLENLECVGNTEDMGGDRVSALPFYITWNQWDNPIATSYDSKQKNFEFAHYTRWPIGTGSLGSWDRATRVGFVAAAVSTNDSDPTNTSNATAISTTADYSDSSGTPENGTPEGAIIGLIFGVIFALVAILGAIFFLHRRRHRARLSPDSETPSVSQPGLSTRTPIPTPSVSAALTPGQRLRLANERTREARALEAHLAANPPRRGTVELAELDPPPLYQRNPGTGELPLERAASGSSHGGVGGVSERSSMVGSDVALVGNGGAQGGAGTGEAGSGGEFLTVPGQQSTPPVVPAGEAPPYTVLRD